MARDRACKRADVRRRRPTRSLARSLRRTTPQRGYLHEICGRRRSLPQDLDVYASRSPSPFWAPFQRLAELPLKRANNTGANKTLRNAEAARRLTRSRFHRLIIRGRHSGREHGASPFAAWRLLRVCDLSMARRQSMPKKRSPWRRHGQALNRRCGAPEPRARRDETDVDRRATRPRILLAVVNPWRPTAGPAHPVCEANPRLASSDGA